ncbi:M1 family metallopeptidase [Paenibacillus sp. GSMTC-2017]|uniref:M1 family metallopeptidase n=1 Tax=Paenibacillus sp. GSMTC-2017 TaxID=2794350 RepID=UPI0018D61E57|nr:M1 family metallopeptidase [Paenibacillus sp. GSMTC-2017]MBH5319824.1 M1 family metallopeptidase [Paenibacillus sp. GSMTC-2017]
MTPRNIKRLIFSLLGAVLLIVSVKYGFGNAWQSQYTYAFAPAAKAMQPVSPAPISAKPPVVQQPDATVSAKNKPMSKWVVDYHINVALRDDGQHLDGTQDVTWTNPGEKPVSELYFHLYPNAFLSPKTTFMTESGGKLRQDKATANSRSHLKLLTLQTLEGESLLPRLQYTQPDDGNKSDFTLARLRLLEPVAPGKSVTLRMSFEVKLPEVFARMGYSGNFIMAGQWFPKLAVYETVGMRGRASEGWNVHQYHGNSEFYSDFGIYSVAITVPESYTVAATGFQTKPTVISDGTKLFQFYAEDVHDFAWSASPDFVYEETAFSDDGIPGVRIKLYLDPTHAGLKDRYMHAAKSALSNYAKWYGPYPYNTLSIVVPPKGANGAGGMEYPTLVTSFAAESESPGYDLERTVVHEIGHQFFYGMVASNEFEEAWLDEGFTSFAEDKVMAAAYGINSNLRMEASYMTHPAPLKQPSWVYANHRQYAENVYMRAKLVLVDIENKVGEHMMSRIMRTYFQKYKFKHPTTADFQRVVEHVTKAKWTEYFNQFVYSNEMADFSVEAIQVKAINRDDGNNYESNILIKKNGGTNGPIPILFTFADGTSISKVWLGDEAHIQYTELSDSPLKWVSVDPEHTNVLDNKLINNYMLAELPNESRTRWSLAVTKLIEGLLSSLSW